MLKRALFLDRDGVINIDTGYTHKIEQWQFITGIFPLLSYFKERDFALILVTNQSGIGRGYYTMSDFIKLSNFMQNEFKTHLGFLLDAIYLCPHAPKESCLCRKPLDGMIQQGAKDFEINLGESWIIGDKMSDIEAGSRAGIPHRILFDKGAIHESFMQSAQPNKPTFIVNSLTSLVDFLAKNNHS